jgi:hypothetical protein
MIVNIETKTLSFGRVGACYAPGTACVEMTDGALTIRDLARRETLTLGAAMAGQLEDALDSGADNARDAHLRFVTQSNLEAQAVTKPMDRIATGCVVDLATHKDSCEGDNKVCRMESVDHCKTRCPIAAGPELWTCLEACDTPGSGVSPYYERFGYCGPKNIVDRCQDHDPDVVACSGSQVWAGGFDCKDMKELFRCDDGQTCRSFVTAVTREGQRKSVEQLKRELCKARTASPATGESQP